MTKIEKWKEFATSDQIKLQPIEIDTIEMSAR